jgi:plasmid stabilization system protein ParE
MSDLDIVFSPRAKQRLEEIAEYLYEQNCSRSFVVNYLKRIEQWMDTLLCQFPESGTPMPELGDDIRRVVFKYYSFLYRIHNNQIEILTIYRENLP